MNSFKNLCFSTHFLRHTCTYRTNYAIIMHYVRSNCYSKFSKEDKSNLQLGDMNTKYKPFKEEESGLILDVYEEREKLKYSKELLAEHEEPDDDIYEGINLERGVTGVFDIEELVELLKRENAMDIFVANVPSDHNYVDYIVVVTGKSKRHMQAISQFVRRVYKLKKHKADLVPKIEGADSNDWMAMDMGNIALHVFSPQARIYYDLDSLWAVGPEYDKEFNKKDDIVELLEKHSIFLKNLQPAT